MVDLGYNKYGVEILRVENCMQCCHNSGKETYFKCIKTKRNGSSFRGSTCKYFELSEEDRYTSPRYKTRSHWYNRGYRVKDGVSPIIYNDLELYSIDDVECFLSYLEPAGEEGCAIWIADDLSFVTLTLNHKIETKRKLRCFHLISNLYVYICSLNKDYTLSDLIRDTAYYFFTFIHKGYYTYYWDEVRDWFDLVIEGRTDSSLEEYIKSMGYSEE